jgi:hypothetical protein
VPEFSVGAIGTTNKVRVRALFVAAKPFLAVVAPRNSIDLRFRGPLGWSWRWRAQPRDAVVDRINVSGGFAVYAQTI